MLAAAFWCVWMRDQLEQILSKEQDLLRGRCVRSIGPVGGGELGACWRADLSDGSAWFLKISDPALLEAEQRGLRSLRRWADANLVEVVDVLAWIPLEHRGVLVLPWWEMGNGDQFNLGRGLARLHRRSSLNGPSRFGWDHDGFIGLGPQPAGWCDDWGKAFVELRLKPQLRLAEAWSLHENHFSSLLAPLAQWLGEHGPDPCLVHGDLWAGNAGVLADGRGLLIDPASWWADREVDLAMTQLFGGFSHRFLEGYNLEWPLPEGAEQRVEALNLYHLLNHANLFGGGYQARCRQVIDRLRKTLL